MTKAELAEMLAQKTAQYELLNGPVEVHAESVDQQKRLARSLETRKRPAHLTKEEFTEYLYQASIGKMPAYRPGDDIWLTETDPVTGKMKFEVHQD